MWCTVGVLSREIHCTVYAMFDPSCHTEHLDLLDVTYSENFNVILEHDFFFGNMSTTKDDIAIVRLIDPYMDYIPFQLLSTFPKLIDIYIERTHLGVLKSAFFQSHTNYENLKSFGCSYCQIYSIDDATFSKMKNIETLILKNNDIKVITFAMLDQNSNLKSIDLSNNKINFIENYQTFGRHSRLRYLNLKLNKCVSTLYVKKTTMLTNISNAIALCTKNFQTYQKLGMDMNYEETEVEKLYNIMQQQQSTMITAINSSIIWAAVWTVIFYTVFVCLGIFGFFFRCRFSRTHFIMNE